MSNKDVTENNSENGLNLINKASSYTFCKPKMVLSRSEKEELVKQLYTEGKTVREIAKAVHMSFSPITAIIRKVTGDNNKDIKNKSMVSTETKALRLFSNGNSPVDVAIKLDISSSEAEELYLGFWRLSLDSLNY